MPSPRGNALIGQSGGPTAVMNQSLVGLVEGCLASDRVGEVYGALRGVQGVLDEDLVDLGRETPEDLEAVARTTCAALQSVRKKPDRSECERALAVFRAHDIRYFFYIGGNDSAESAGLLNEVAVDEGYDVRLFHVPKTIDNDLCVTDHCPGYGSAARFVAHAIMGDEQDNLSLGGVKIDVIMGRNAGWLTASSRLARSGDEGGPHLIYLPEVAFDVDGFLGDIEDVCSRHGRCLIALSEGIKDGSGELISKSQQLDVFGNVQLSGTALGSRLAQLVGERLGPKLRIRADTFGFIQRSFVGCISEQDAIEAREVGRHAVRVATSDDVSHGSLVILREGDGGEYRPRYDVTALEDVARVTKELPARWIEGRNGVAEAFLDYVRPLAGPLPEPGRLAGHAVPKKL